MVDIFPGGQLKKLLLLTTMSAVLGAGPAFATDPVRFEWFQYDGRDVGFEPRPAEGTYRNPILPGYYPDPSVTRVGDKFYLVNSTFAHWPGIPIHESTDLVNWKLIGYALNDPSKINYDGLDISRGVFAPAIDHHEGTYYVINTLADAGGNFFVTSKNPGGPYSDPVWLREIDGIDPAFFFDDDGKAYILNNGPPVGTPRYDGHRAIWLQEFDVKAQKVVGPRKVIVDAGANPANNPIWIEGPHIYKVDGTYYLMCAEGGTGYMHSEVVFRSKSPWGPWEPYAGNPILTQRDLGMNRRNGVTSTGHADLTQKPDGSWWAVFLGTRPYSNDRYNTGRETFLLPVTWKDGWPIILPKGVELPRSVYLKDGRANDLAWGKVGPAKVDRDEFDGKGTTEWLQIYVPKKKWHAIDKGALRIEALDVRLDEKRNSSFLARRQQDLKFDASTELGARAPGIAAGLAAYQNADHWYFLGARTKGNQQQIFLERRGGKETKVVAETLVTVSKPLRLRIRGMDQNYSFDYDAGSGWTALVENDDGSILSTEVAGGFVGTVLGPYARIETK
jgi:xylan 1,4-beta-xylosidase